MHHQTPCETALQPLRPGGWWREWEFAVLGILVLSIYFLRISAVAVCGEESRWANVAREMIASGDWIVPRQQGVIFPERPPLGSWAMAAVGLLRGQVDLVAVRLPGALAILAMTWIIYGYTRRGATRLAGFAAAVIFATIGQVLQLGRSGESEPLFTLFVGGSLLVWHWGYQRGWPQLAMWSSGYSLAALGALVKGPQAPVYFVSVCAGYLVWQRQWRQLASLAHVAGIACFALIVGAWLTPFALREAQAVDDIWAGLAQDRFSLSGMAGHIISYPFETFGCLLPWSPLLLALVKPGIWRSLLRDRPQVKFLLFALAVTYPTVWIAAGARGRYYMPLYPCIAVLMGLLVERCAAEGASLADRRMWRRFVRGMAVTVAISGMAVAVAAVVPLESLAGVRQPTGFTIAWILAAVGAAAILTWTSLGQKSHRPRLALAIMAAFLGLAYTGALVNTRVEGANDLTQVVDAVKQRVESPERIVSLGRVYHRFAYCYETPIREVNWPLRAEELPSDVTYFCFDRKPGDTPQERSGSDGRYGANTPGTLPFAWEPVAEIACDPVKRGQAHRTVVIGRVRRGALVAEPPVSQPVRR